MTAPANVARLFLVALGEEDAWLSTEAFDGLGESVAHQALHGQPHTDAGVEHIVALLGWHGPDEDGGRGYAACVERVLRRELEQRIRDALADVDVVAAARAWDSGAAEEDAYTRRPPPPIVPRIHGTFPRRTA